jgi:hypothetical protein
MMLNPRYGVIGMVTLPYYLVFELLGPVIELLGIAAVLASLALGLVNVPFAILFALAAFGYGLVVSLASICAEELSYHRYHRWRDLGSMMVAAVVEQMGPRQLQTVWRLQGLWSLLRAKDAVWVPLARTGFGGFGAVGTAHAEVAATVTPTESDQATP